MRFEARDFPEHGISLIVPSDPSFGHLEAKREPTSLRDPYSVLLKNTGTRAVVGYSISWQCFDDRGETSDRNLSNDRTLNRIFSWVFLYGEESDRRAAVDASEDIIKPHSISLISSDRQALPLAWSPDVVGGSKTQLDESSKVATIQGCARMTVIADGVFFDDGSFIGPDNNGIFTRVKSEMDARYELLRGIQNDLKSGKKSDEIFKELEKIRDGGDIKAPEHPTADGFRAYFRNMFVRDVLGRKEHLGVDSVIEDIQLKLSKPWVNLRKF